MTHRASISPSRPRLLAAFLLELAAVLELGLWEQQDLRRHIDVDLPTYRKAAKQLAARCMKGPAEFKGPMAAPLSHQVLLAWADHFAWDGRELLQTDVIVGELDDDEFVELLAQFVWTHRLELESLALGDGHK